MKFPVFLGRKDARRSRTGGYFHVVLGLSYTPGLRHITVSNRTDHPMRILVKLLALLTVSLSAALPAHAAVTITFWSHELGDDFPHAFLSLRGVPDAGGPPVDISYGYTLRTVSPAALFGRVPARLDLTTPGYMRRSDAQFSLTLTDAQYRDMVSLAYEWSRPEVLYDLNGRNCVHFTKEAARRLGLVGVDQPKLMKKPRSYMKALAAANAGRVVVVAKDGDDYLAALPPLPAPPVAPRLAVVPPPVVPTLSAGTSSIRSSSDSKRG